MHTLYTFRRCPYAMRARMALHYAQVPHTQVEVDLKNKPAALLALSPKATVPVLHMEDGTVLEQSLDIMHYALSQRDPGHWRLNTPEESALISQNDTEFKPLLDRYKYHTRHPELPRSQHQQNGEAWLQSLETLLQQHPFLLADRITLADIALFPFIRQWHGAGGDSLPHFPRLLHWLNHHQSSPLFTAIMQPD